MTWKRAVVWAIVLNEVRGLLTVAWILWIGKGIIQ